MRHDSTNFPLILCSVKSKRSANPNRDTEDGDEGDEDADDGKDKKDRYRGAVSGSEESVGLSVLIQFGQCTKSFFFRLGERR